MKVLWLTNVPSPYRVDFFNELGKCCDLTVLFEKSTSDERDKSWKLYSILNFKGVFLNGKSISTDSAVCPDVIKYLGDKSFDAIICSTFTDYTGMIAVQYMKLKRIPYYLECDGGFAKSGKGLKERIKKYFIKGAKGYFSTGISCDEYFLTYGAEQHKLLRYPFSSLWRNDILSEPVSSEEKLLIRKRLGISESNVIVTVGQFIHRKGFDLLLEVSKDLSDNTAVFIVGGIPTEEYLQIKNRNNLNHVYFEGYKSKYELIDFYKAADLFVLPTREDIWGLVVEEAMANALPVISTDKCGAALELVKNYKNGFIVKNESILELKRYTLMLLEDERLRKQFAIAALSSIQEYTIEKMVSVHLDYLGSA